MAEKAKVNRITTKDPAEKAARRRLSVLELVERLGSVSEACRRSGMDRTSYYEWKRRFQLYGLEGLKDLPPIHKTHPQTTPPEVVDKILELALQHPTWGCTRYRDFLKLQGISVSSSTVQNILIKHGLASKYERLLRLEEKSTGGTAGPGHLLRVPNEGLLILGPRKLPEFACSAGRCLTESRTVLAGNVGMAGALPHAGSSQKREPIGGG